MSESFRYCRCGARLSRYNSTRMCGPCAMTSRDQEMFGRRGTTAKKVIDVYTRPCDYDSAQAYLKALTSALNALCRAHDVKHPTDIAEVFEERRSENRVADNCTSKVSAVGDARGSASLAAESSSEGELQVVGR